jgi:hypothetical protein
MTEPKCPRCAVALVEESHATRRYLACEECAGCFAPVETIAHFRQDARTLHSELPHADATPPIDYRGEVRAPERPAPGPMCGAPMTSRPRYMGGEATVDTCTHGAWFDAQELSRTVDALWKAPTETAVAEARSTRIKQGRTGSVVADRLLQRLFDRLLT